MFYISELFPKIENFLPLSVFVSLSSEICQNRYLSYEKMHPVCNIIKTWVKQELKMSKLPLLFPLCFQFTLIELVFPLTQFPNKIGLIPIKISWCLPVYLI